MQKDRLEEKLRESLGDYPSPIDLEGAWSKLEHTRNKEKKRRGAWFWWLGGAVAVFGLLILALHSLNEDEQAPITAQLEDTNIAPPETLREDASPNQQKLTTSSEIKPFINRDTELDRKASPQESTTAQSPEDQGAFSSPILARRAYVTEELDKKSSESEGSTGKDPAIIYNRSSSLELRERLSSLPVRSIVPWMEGEEEAIHEGLPLVKELTRRRTDSGGWWIGLSSSVGIQDRALRVNSLTNSETESLLTRREGAETELEAYSLGFDIRKDLRPNWYFQTGIRHQVAFERFEDEYERTFDKVLEDQVTEIIQRADGTTTEIRGDVTVPVTESAITTIYNTQNLTELPILVGYRKALTRDIGLDLNLGFVYGFIQRKEGKIHSDGTSIGEYRSLGQMPYRKSNLWGAQVQGGISYALGDRWRCLGALQTKAYPNIAKANADFSERQLLLNAVIGLQYQIGQ